MADYYSGSPLPTPAPGTLPYPWITQFDPSHQTTFYVNVETQESTWTLPDLNSLSTSQHASMDGGIRAMPNNYHGGGAAGDSCPPATYQHPGDSARGSGEASSFYASSGTVPQSPGESTHADQAQTQYDENGQPIQGDGERGLGKVIVGGGAMYLAYKLYKDYQKGKLNQQQFKPPNPSNATPQTHPTNGSYPYVQHPQSHFGPPKRDNVAPAPNWDQKPYSAYGGPPPGPYVTGGNYQVGVKV